MKQASNRRSALAMVGAGALVASLAACGGDSSGSEDKELHVLFNVNSQYPEEQQAWFKAIGDEFKAETGATVVWETFATPNDELTKIQTSVVSGEGPDVYSLGTTFTPTAYSTDAFVTLGDSEWEKVGGKDKFVPATLGISGPDESKQIGIPFVSRPFVMAYNTEMLEEAGIAAPATSWDELTEQAKQLTKGGQYGLAVAYKDTFDPWKFIWGMSIQAGNPIVDGEQARIQDPVTQKAYETYFGWLTEDKVVDPASTGWANAQALAAFAQGEAAYFPMTSALSARTFDESPVKDKYAYALLPTVPPGMTSRPGDGEEAASILSGDNLVVADYSEQQDLAFQFIKMITDEDAQVDYYKTFGQIPVNTAAAASLSEDPKLEAVLESASKSVATPFTGAWADVQLALTNVVVQSIPELAKGNVSEAALADRMAAAQEAAASAVARAQ